MVPDRVGASLWKSLPGVSLEMKPNIAKSQMRLAPARLLISEALRRRPVIIRLFGLLDFEPEHQQRISVLLRIHLLEELRPLPLLEVDPKLGNDR